MKYFFAFYLLVGLSVPLSSFAGFTVPPVPNSHVSDQARVLSGSFKRSLNGILSTVKNSRQIELVILTVESLEGLAIEQASIEIVDKWKLGTAAEDNGILLLLAMNDRKLRIEVGQGLEGTLTDVYSNRIIQQTIVPLLKSGNIDQAIYLGAYQILQTADPTYD
ncbi:MAG: TPM domain-containing protein [Bdellovibrionales bacterium]